MGRRSSRKLTPAKLQDLKVAAAIAREAVVQLHVEHALALIRYAAGEVSEPRMLDIYLRLLDLSGPASDVIANRVLASLGHRRPAAERDIGPERDANDVAEEDGHSMLRTLRRRLRGRVHDQLRYAVELKTGAAHAALLDLHVRHARGFVRLLEQTHSIAAACDAYTDAVHVPTRLNPALYTLVVDRIAADEGLVRNTRAEARARAEARRLSLSP